MGKKYDEDLMIKQGKELFVSLSNVYGHLIIEELKNYTKYNILCLFKYIGCLSDEDKEEYKNVISQIMIFVWKNKKNGKRR